MALGDGLLKHSSITVVGSVCRAILLKRDCLGSKGIGHPQIDANSLEFLRDPTHKLCFTSPQALLWLNQIEIWFSILVRKLLRRANFINKTQLKSILNSLL